MHKSFLSIAAVLGALSVALGAFAAHRLKEIVSPDAVSVFETGVRYQFYHVFALLFVGLISERVSNRWVIWAGNCFIMGIIFFCGSLVYSDGVEGGGYFADEDCGDCDAGRRGLLYRGVVVPVVGGEEEMSLNKSYFHGGRYLL